ncbi:multicellular organismal development [Nesidiocoris tenuis]|uniref:Multicellular organismal development n=1 Tax=Nesidiocoris tenuis TaxID=355587 RepID=A0ABN7AZZ3_9HEMI|nr:multicellular organismal development [Nesidiocoris tenuis]
MSDQTAATVATTFFNGWVSRFGAPITVVADRGRNFESSLFHQVSSLLGIEIRHTTSYHPQCNGLVERSHRSIKAALMSRLEDSRSDWYYELPIVLLGLRSVVKPDIGATPSELVYGTTLRLPGELLEKSTENVNAPTIDYVVKLRSLFDRVRPADTNWHSSQKVFSNPALNTASHVYLRFDGVRHSLQRPYTGPYRVLRRTPKTFDILINNKRSTVSRDRLKPAFVLPDQTDQASSPTPSLPNRSPSPTPDPDATPLPDTPALPRSTTTRSGRRVRFPSALSDFTI